MKQKQNWKHSFFSIIGASLLFHHNCLKRCFTFSFSSDLLKCVQASCEWCINDPSEENINNNKDERVQEKKNIFLKRSSDTIFNINDAMHLVAKLLFSHKSRRQMVSRLLQFDELANWLLMHYKHFEIYF